jgi:very-short-patch-repair endonuclease
MTDTTVKYLRENQTRAEQILWQRLRLKRVGNLRFRRQYRIGSYIVDFVCLQARLIVEIDGESHNMTIDRDQRRQEWLESQGFRIIRFMNSDVRANLEGVVQAIELEIGSIGIGARKA